ncbi:hypothetical protein BE17_30745 [Sorangium cellulosum]|uniref:Uncharacterized protein n=1 Tax=Sorangium cellulosum TaxID=56 RepID=A0A150RWW9_SORCE|nr:hypothetical protein BE17_30745 [Sorangium cellulosum]
MTAQPSSWAVTLRGILRLFHGYGGRLHNPEMGRELRIEILELTGQPTLLVAPRAPAAGE